MTEDTAKTGNRAEVKTDTYADDLSDLPADFGKARTNGHSPPANPYARSSASASGKLAAKWEAAAAAQEATDKRRKRWGSRRYALSVLDGREEHWARKAVSEITRWNAGRDPTRDMPRLMFSGTYAVNMGATDAQIKALPELTPSETSALRIHAAATREHCRALVRRKAASMATPRQPLAEVVRHVSDMANDPPTGTIVDGLIYERMVIHWVGDGGTYKTFTALSLSCSVAAGVDFTHQLKVPAKLPVLYLCAARRHYGLGADVAAWCRTAGLDIDDLLMAGWDNVVQLADEDWMAELTDYVKANGVKLVVFDTQRKATKGIEENSSTDIGAALANAQKLAMEADAAVIVIHHTARGQDHARGTSAGRDDTDATVVQKVTGPKEAQFVIDKHKSEATGTTYPVKVQTVKGTMPPTGDRAGYDYTTLVATARDPLSMDETAAKVKAALTANDKILVEVVNAATDGPLPPSEVVRRAQAQGCTLGKDAVASHLDRLAKDGYGRQVAQHVNPVNGRKTYSPRSDAPAPDAAPGPDDVSADVVDLTARRSGKKPARNRRPRKASKRPNEATPTPQTPETPPPTD